MYEDILLPFDGREDGSEVLRHVGELARWADATVHVLFVADTTRDSVTVVGNQVVDALVREGESTVEEAEGVLESLGVDHRSDVVQGNPAQAIVAYADQYGMDLIVAATRGREGVSRYLAGSVSEKVVRLSPVPVLTTRTRADERLEFPYERVLVATDGSDDANRAATHGLTLASALDATVHVLSVVDDAALGFDVRSVASAADRDRVANEAIDHVVAEATERGIADPVRHVEHGSPVEEILAVIEDHDVDLAVLGTTGRRGTDRILLGSVAERTVRSAPVPVLTVGDQR